MATISKRGTGWQAKIRRRGYPTQTATFDTKGQAQAWASDVEARMAQLKFVDTSAAEKTTLRSILARYEREVSAHKKGRVQEFSKIAVISRHEIVDRYLSQLTSSDIAFYRDDRLKKVSPKTVRTELTLIGHALKIAESEWHITLPRGNPVDAVRKPTATNSRDRRLKSSRSKKKDEETRLLAAADAYGGTIGAAIILAIETGMRRGELVKMRWGDIDFRKRIVHLSDTKNGESRNVPLSKRAAAALHKLKKASEQQIKESKSNLDLGYSYVLGMKPDSITRAFRRICEREKIEGLRWHDLRHEAASRLFEKGLNPMEVAAVTGHKTLQMLKRYTHLRAEDLVNKLG